MKKYLLSTLTAAAAMAVPAWADATLLGSWDFSTATAVATGSGTYTIASTTGNLSITTGSELNTETGNLVITSSSDADHETTIDLASQSISVEEGISIVMTIEGWNFTGGNSDHYILGSIASSSRYDYVAAGMTGSIGAGEGTGTFWGGANGSDGGLTRTAEESYSFTEGQSTEIIITFIGNTVTVYQNGVELGYGTINSYDSSATINGAAIGSWDSAGGSGSSVGNEPGLTISSLEIWKGDVTTLPEPALFSIFFSVGALGLVATRRRKRA